MSSVERDPAPAPSAERVHEEEEAPRDAPLAGDDAPAEKGEGARERRDSRDRRRDDDRSEGGRERDSRRRGRSPPRRRRSRSASSVDSREVTRLCQLRADYRRSRDYRRADRILDDLGRLGVRLDDRSHMWESRCGKRGSYSGRKRRGSSVDSVEVDDMCQQRQACKTNREYSRADRIRENLLDMGVYLNDDRCEWSCDHTGQRGHWNRWGREDRRRGGGGDRRRRRTPSSSSSSSSRSRDRRRRR